MPEGRLEELLEQALTQQFSKVEISNQAHLPISLLTDFAYTKTRVPKHTTQVRVLPCPESPLALFCPPQASTTRECSVPSAAKPNLDTCQWLGPMQMVSGPVCSS